MLFPPYIQVQILLYYFSSPFELHLLALFCLPCVLSLRDPIHCQVSTNPLEMKPPCGDESWVLASISHQDYC